MRLKQVKVTLLHSFVSPVVETSLCVRKEKSVQVAITVEGKRHFKKERKEFIIIKSQKMFLVKTTKFKFRIISFKNFVVNVMSTSFYANLHFVIDSSAREKSVLMFYSCENAFKYFSIMYSNVLTVKNLEKDLRVQFLSN